MQHATDIELQVHSYAVGVADIDAFGVNKNRWILSSYAHVTPIHPRSIDGKRPGPSMQMYGVQNLSTACWRLEAVAQHPCKLNVALHYWCLPVKALLHYCRQSSTHSQQIPDFIHLHWGARSFAIDWAWVDGRNVGVTTQYSSISVQKTSIAGSPHNVLHSSSTETTQYHSLVDRQKMCCSLVYTL